MLFAGSKTNVTQEKTCDTGSPFDRKDKNQGDKKKKKEKKYGL